MYKIHTVICICSSCCLITKSYLTLCDTMDCSSPGSSVHGIFQARILEWVAISFSRGSSYPGIKPMSPTLAGRLYHWATRKANTVQKSLYSVQFSSVAQSCLTLWDPMNHIMPGLPIHHQILESTQTHVHRVDDIIQPSHPLSSPSPPAFNLSQHQGLSQWVSSSHQVAKVLEFQLQHQSFQWTPRTDVL